jgi:oxaloacetate decarboxylase alpha subunit
MAEIFKGTPYDTGMDIELLAEIAAYFRDVRRKYKSYESAFVGADTRILVSQVPGGMLSNLESQLREQDAADKIDDVLAEIAVVQKDFGYPPLVTPTSQIVGTQAVMNVLFGRYQRLTNESRNLLVGHYGATPVAPSPTLVKQALHELKMPKPVESRPADHLPAEMERLGKEIREKTGLENVNAEDVLTYAMFPQVALAFFQTRSKGPVRIEAPADKAPPAPAAEKPAAPPAGAPAQSPEEPSRYVIRVDEDSFAVTATPERDGRFVVTVDGHSYAIAVGEPTAAAAEPPPQAAGQGAPVLAPMPGTVIKLACADGATVQKDQTVLILEALKMQMEIRSTAAGRIRYCVRPNDAVKAKAVLAEVS